jgi:hypothetical protein
MKNETTNPKTSRVKPPLVLAACLILTALGLPTSELSRAQGRGSPPGDVNQTFIFRGNCGFDVQATVTGKEGVITLPSGGFIFTAPALFGTFTNLSDPTKSVTLNLTGLVRVSFDQNGDTIYMATGRNQAADPSFGLLLLVGDFIFVYDSNGNLVQGPTGNGQITSICDLID